MVTYSSTINVYKSNWLYQAISGQGEYIKVREGEVFKTRALREGLYVFLSKKDQILGIEILPSKSKTRANQKK